MSLSHVFKGYFNREKTVDKGRRRLLIVELGEDETAALDAHLGRNAHRSQNIPITFVIGEAGQALATIRDEFVASPAAGAPEPEPPPPGPCPAFAIDLARRVEAVAELTTQRVLADWGMRTWTPGDRRRLAAALDELNETARAVAQEACR